MDNANGVTSYYAMAIDVCFAQTAKSDSGYQKYVKYVCMEDGTRPFIEKSIYENSDCSGQPIEMANITSKTEAPCGLPGDTFNCFGSNTYTFVNYYENMECIGDSNGDPLFRIPVVDGCFCDANNGDEIESYHAKCGKIQFYESTSCSNFPTDTNTIDNGSCTLSGSPNNVYAQTADCFSYYSLSPTIDPTENPTQNPIKTDNPSASPSFYPIIDPTLNPSSNPIVSSTMSRINQTESEKNSDENEKNMFGDYHFVKIGLMVGSILPIICVIIGCYHCVDKQLTNEPETNNTNHTIQRLQSGSPIPKAEDDTLEIVTKKKQSAKETKNTTNNVFATPGKGQGIVMMGFVNENEKIETNKSSNIEMKSVLVKNMHTSTVSIDEMINAQTNTQQTTKNNAGEEGINKYCKIENILKEIDEDEYKKYLTNFKKQKVDDDAVFGQNLFPSDHEIWKELMAEIGVRAKFLNAMQLNNDADI